MNNLLFNQDEAPTTQQQIELAEKIWGTKFPEEYKSFLLAHNGGEIYPNTPSIETTEASDELWWIERFCSVNDLILQKKYAMGYTYLNQHEEEDLQEFGVSRKDLLTIAVAGRGCYYINLSKKQFGQIYHANYQGGDGFMKLKTKSFNEFLSSMKPFIEEDLERFEGFEKTRKTYDSRYYYTPEQPHLGLERFQEVLSFLGDANSKARDSDWTVVQHYAYVNAYDKMGDHIFEYLLNNGGKTEGLLLRVKDCATILKLIKEYGANINEPFKGRYPIHMMTGTGSMSNAKSNYELLDQILNAEIELDLSIKDKDGLDVIERLKKLVDVYEEYRAYDKEKKKRYPEHHNFMTSDVIMKLIQRT